MQEDEIYCLDCDAAAFPSFPWQGEGHIAVRFWDTPGHPHHPPYYGLLNGKFVPLCWEIMAGSRGWAIQCASIGNREPLCPRCGPLGILYRVLFGDVTVSLIDPRVSVIN